MMKIVYLIAGTYRAAGMERVLANKANALAKDGNELIIVTTDQRGQKPAFMMDTSIRMIDLGINYEDNNGATFINKLIHYPVKQIKHKKRLRAILMREQANIVVSMFCNDARFLPKIKDGSKKILEIHFSRFKRLQYGRKGIWAIADKIRSQVDIRTVKKYDKFIVLTKEDKDYWGNLPNIQVIPNARTFACEFPAPLDAKQVLAVGRYNFQKQFDSLIDCWKIVGKSHPDWILRIVGEGEEQDEMEKRIISYGLESQVILGPESNMENVYSKASILVMSSLFEGLPMVLLEAQSSGLPIISFKCKCGPRDVVTDGVDGYLVEEGNIQELASRISELICDEKKRKKMGAAAFIASARFDESIIMGKWKKMFATL